MSTGAFSIDQLMELAGLSVSQAGIYTTPTRLSSEVAKFADEVFGQSLQSSPSEQGTQSFGSLWSGKQWSVVHFLLSRWGILPLRLLTKTQRW